MEFLKRTALPQVNSVDEQICSLQVQGDMVCQCTGKVTSNRYGGMSLLHDALVPLHYVLLLIAVRAEVLVQCESLAPESVLLTDVLAPPGESKLSSFQLGCYPRVIPFTRLLCP